jgi:hypothetical protein
MATLPGSPGFLLPPSLIHSNGSYGVVFAQRYVVVASHPLPYGQRAANSQQRFAHQDVNASLHGVRLIGDEYCMFIQCHY